MIAGGPQWARSATRRSHRSWRPRRDRLGPHGDRWPFPGIPFGLAESFGGAGWRALDRIASMDGELSSFIAIEADRARRAAKAAEEELKNAGGGPAWRADCREGGLRR